MRSNWKRKRDADGRRLCLVCEAPLSGRRTSYCSDEHRAINSPGIMRERVWRRDKGVCALCGLDTKTLPKATGWRASTHAWEADHILPVSEGGGLCGLEGYRTLCKACHGKVSGELRRRLNERKRLEKLQRDTGRLF